MTYVVETSGLGKCFGPQTAVSDLSIHVPKGAVYGLVGPNGAGKTTALKMILGLLRASEGHVRLFGEPWRRQHLERIGALIETPALYENLTGPENLAIHTRLLGLSLDAIWPALGRVGLSNVGDKVVSAYSLGMRQRLGIAITLLGDPDLLILDEPANGLDPVGIREMRDLIRSLGADNITVVVSSHLLSEVEQVATHVGMLVGGRLRFEGTLESLLERDEGHLVLQTQDVALALAVLASRFPGARVEDGRVLVPVPESQAAEAVAILYQAGIVITRLSYEDADLETQFIRLLEPYDGPATRQQVVLAEARR